MLKRDLPARTTFREGTIKWYCFDPSCISLLKRISKEYPELLSKGTVTRCSNLVFRYPEGQKEASPLFVKVYTVRHLKDRVRESLGAKHRHYGLRYGISEVSNLLEAGKRGINRPEVYALGEIKEKALIRSYMVVMEYLSGFQTLSQVLAQSETKKEQPEVLRRTGAVLLDLWKKGVFHGDPSSRNVMISSQNREDVKIVDFEYVRFLSRPDKRLLAFQAGYLFRKWCREVVSEDLYDSWAFSLLDLPIHTAGDSKADQWLGFYRMGKERDFSRKEILSLTEKDPAGFRPGRGKEHANSVIA